MIEFETARLRVRKLSHEDTEAVFSMLHKPEVSQYLYMEPQTDLDKTKELMRYYIDNENNVPFAVEEKETGNFVGVTVLKMVEGDPSDYEITTFSDTPYWNKGYAGEVFVGLVDYARDRLHLRTLTAGALVANKASNALLKKRGFQWERVEFYPDCPEGLNWYHLPLLEPLPTQLRPGRYRHFKGKEYRLLSVGRHSETLEAVVVYQALYGEEGIWVRPARMWNETVETPEGPVERFAYLGD